MKYIFAILLGFISLYSTSIMALEAKWFGVTSVYITDGESSILFDPIITKPTIGHWMFNLTFKSNRPLVDKMLAKLEIEKVDLIFISHQHFDHSIDAPYVALKTGATVVASPSQEIITRAVSSDISIKSLPYEKDIGDVIEIGKFKITPLRRNHSAIIHSLDFHFTPGPVKKDFNFKFYDYKLGENFAYFIEHPDGNIIFDQGGQYNPLNDHYLGKVDYYFTGVANKKNLHALTKNNIAKINAKKTFPLHFDFFPLQSNFLERLPLPKVGIDEISEELKRIGYDGFHIPKWGETLKLVK
ncbi:MBL fold metallo-hydrolase [Bacteriovoracaceae bacterium]|nr:MBL fold metallo-hydrolase [Bacteriovoracaceae bacterium]